MCIYKYIPASYVFVPTNTKNHQLPFQEVDGFLLVEAPAPSPGACKTLWVTLAQSSGYAIENRLLEWVCSQKINGQKPNSKPDKNQVKRIRPIELGHDMQQLLLLRSCLFCFSGTSYAPKLYFHCLPSRGKRFSVKCAQKLHFQCLVYEECLKTLISLPCI